MDNKLTILKLSKKVKAYIEEVKKETGYNVSIEDFQGKGAMVTLDHECKYIRVEINEEEYKKDSEEEIDYTIAHEVTHEFLSLKKKYCRIRCGPEEKEPVRILATMIEDVVVDKIIQEKNYRSSYTKYLDDVKGDIKFFRKHANKDRDFFEVHKDDPRYKFLFKYMVFRYILAWEYVEYLNSDKIDKKTIHKFLKIFQKSCPKLYEEAENIKKIILENNIFTPEGYDNTIKECLDLWNLTNLVEIYTC